MKTQESKPKGKRPRPEWKNASVDPSAVTPATEPDTKKAATHANANEETESQEVDISPHTLRLLRLVQEGSSEHAKVAASHLSVVTASACPLVLWEILGRLQFFLLSPEWRTRHNASLAMEGVAQHLPIEDQQRFLQDCLSNTEAMDPKNESSSTKSANNNAAENNNKNSNGNLWLNLSDLKQGKMQTILEHGRHLMSSSEKPYEEEEALQELDANQEGYQDYCERRIQLQRRLLASRLGLGRMVDQVGTTKDLDIVMSDLIPSSNQKSAVKTRRRISKKNEVADHSIRAILVMEIRQQQAGDQDDDKTTNNVSHQNAQTLLATELIYRMFDASWYIRHGALIGILALVRAWKGRQLQSRQDNNFNEEYFGSWPQDILSRCLCILALDRFEDFSGATNVELSGGTVAAVREMAGQVGSVVLSMAPWKIQSETLSITLELVKAADWEVRHGALILLKYAIVLHSKTVIVDERWSKELFQKSMIVATASLEDSCDDVQAVAAKILNHLCGHKDATETGIDMQPIIRPLWKTIRNLRLISPCIKDVVVLLSTILEQNCPLVLEEVANHTQETIWDSFRNLLERLRVLLTCESLSVKVCVMQATGMIVGQIVDAAEKAPTATNGDSRNSMNACYCLMIEHIFGLYRHMSLVHDKDAIVETKKLEVASRNLWSLLMDASGVILREDSGHRRRVQKYLVLQYFGLQGKDKAWSGKEAACYNAFQGQRLQMQVKLAKVIARFYHSTSSVTASTNKAQNWEMLEFCLVAALASSKITEVESACFLYRALFFQQQETSSSMVDIKVKCDEILQDYLASTPFCMRVSRARILQFNPQLVNVLHRAFVSGIDLVEKQHGSFLAAVNTVKSIWEKALKVHSFASKEEETTTPDSMRLAVSITGAVVAGGIQCLPQKLTPLIRSLITSIQNELNESCQDVTCSYMAACLQLLSHDVPTERREAFERTCGKIVVNLCNLVTKQTKPGCDAATKVIGLLIADVSKADVLVLLKPMWDTTIHFRNCSIDNPQENRRSLALLQAVCTGLKGRHDITVYVIQEFSNALSVLGCAGDDKKVQSTASELIKVLCKLNARLTLKWTLPQIITAMKNPANNVGRIRACELLSDLVKVCSVEICPFVRSLLPLVMARMTDSEETCARIAASIFALLVRVAPVVDERTSISIRGHEIDSMAQQTINHLIHGQALPPCKLHPEIVESLKQSNTVLRNYQLEGISWLRFLQNVNLNGALCDSMGLGKTLQALVSVALSHLDAESGERPKSLIVCPSSVVGHWVGEINRFFPAKEWFNPLALHGNEAKRKALFCEEFSKCDVIISSYSVLRRDIGMLETTRWNYCILDEGHLLKNPKTLTSRASRRLKSEHKLVLTGTPVQNKVFEVWSTFDFLMPNFLGSASSFSKEFAKPISKGQGIGASATDVATSMDTLKLLHQQVLPFILRREKDQVLQELPPKTITTIKCEMSETQSRMYEDFCSCASAKQSMEDLQRAIDSMKKSDDPLSASHLGSNVLTSFLYLRLLCTYPSLVDSDSDQWMATKQDSPALSGKLQALSELLRDAGIQSQMDKLTAADNDTSLLYCDEESGGDLEDLAVESMLEPEALDSRQMNATASGKRSKCLIFAQFTKSLDVVEKLLLRRNMGSDVGYVRLDGRVPQDKRSCIVDQFNKDDELRVMLLTTRIGGLGLNLTADTVIFLEHDWNPHTDLQAMDRAHRIGQKKHVNVYSLVTADSIEENIMKLHEVKLAMSEAIVNTENSTLFSMGTDRLLDIFRFRSEAGSKESSADLSKTLDALVDRYDEEYQDLSERDFVTGFA
ncbi:MAG: hypothetical protein SGBAC_000648 [Bacillariaceae sp.]